MAFFGRQMSNIAMNLRSAPSPIAYPVGIDVGSGIIEPKLPRTNVGNFRLRSDQDRRHGRKLHRKDPSV